MVDPNWGILQGNNQFMDNFQLGVRLGDRVATTDRARSLDNALASYAKDPNQQNLSMVIDRDPRMGMQLQEREAQRKAAEAKAGQEKAITVAKLFDGIGSEQDYQQRLAMAKRMNIDVSTAPPNYDPAWVAENGAIMKFVAEKPEALSDAGRKAVDKGFTPGTIEFQNDVKTTLLAEATKPIPYQPGGGVATYNAQTGQTQVIVQPNYGDQPAGAPAQPSGNIARPKTKAERDALKPGQQYEAPDGSIRTVPGGASSNTGGGFSGFKRAIIAQESGGRYGVTNAEGSGAMGVGQIMPETGAALAKREGLPWRPDLMRGNSAEARAYQDRLTDAALKEAWQYGGGDPEKAAKYYFAGPNQKGWGSKTRQYGADVTRRMGVR
jgi:hypothetical protein